MIWLMLKHFRSHVGGSAFNCRIKSRAFITLRCRSTTRRAGETEANDFYNIGSIFYHNVVKIKLPMSEALIVDMLKAFKHLSEEVLSN